MRPNGYRYVRQYRNAAGGWAAWALWEVVNGRARRVGTARTEEAKRSFLCCE